MFYRFRHLCLFALLALYLSAGCAVAQAINLLPKYGGLPKNEAQKTTDAKFLAQADEYFKGDRKKAASQVAMTGWKYLRQGDSDGAMRRFNQAWLLDSTNGAAIWGMAVYEAQTGKIEQAFSLFVEADRLIGDDMDFQADFARLEGYYGAELKDQKRLLDAYRRFELVYRQMPQHVMNLQNWAITLFLSGDYAGAWKKIIEAEMTPRHAEIDQKFVAALTAKMPRP